MEKPLTLQAPPQSGRVAPWCATTVSRSPPATSQSSLTKLSSSHLFLCWLKVATVKTNSYFLILFGLLYHKTVEGRGKKSLPGFCQFDSNGRISFLLHKANKWSDVRHPKKNRNSSICCICLGLLCTSIYWGWKSKCKEAGVKRCYFPHVYKVGKLSNTVWWGYVHKFDAGRRCPILRVDNLA